MRVFFIPLLLLSALGLRAQVVEMPRVEMPRVEMPRVELPSSCSHDLRDGGQVRTATGLPAGRWKRTFFSDRIQLIDPSGARGMKLKRSVTGKWKRLVPSGTDSWSLNEDTGTLRKNF